MAASVYYASHVPTRSPGRCSICGRRAPRRFEVAAQGGVEWLGHSFALGQKLALCRRHDRQIMRDLELHKTRVARGSTEMPRRKRRFSWPFSS